MRPPIDGGTILITGASSGIGRAMAVQLAPRAKALVLVARREGHLEALAEQLRAARGDLVLHLLPCDLTDDAARERLLQQVEGEVGDVDVLINNAGVGDFALVEHVPWGRLDAMVKLNVEALLHLTHRLLPPMVARGRGGILNVSSGLGLHFVPGFATYVGTKHFVTGFTESLRLEVRGEGVVVSQLVPGPVLTEFQERAGVVRQLDVPPIAQVSAERCAREGLRGFERNRALITPGVIMRILLALGALVPRWFLRLFFMTLGGRARALSSSKAER